MTGHGQRRNRAADAAYSDREDRAVQLLARCIGDIVGIRSDAYTTLVRASMSENPLDMHLAQATFEALDPELRRRIHDRVREVSARHARAAAE